MRPERVDDGVSAWGAPVEGVTLYLVGRVLSPSWGVLGVYDSQDLAEQQCRTTKDFVWPFQLNVDFPGESAEMEGAYFPLAGDGDAPLSVSAPADVAQSLVLVVDGDDTPAHVVPFEPDHRGGVCTLSPMSALDVASDLLRSASLALEKKAEGRS